MDEWKNVIERCRQRQQEARKEARESSGNGQGKQPEAQAPTQNQSKTGPSDQSSADIRLQTFQEYNQKLSKNKSQIPNLAAHARIFEPVTPGRRKFYKDWRNIPVLGREDISIYQKFHQLNELDRTGLLVIVKFLDSQFVSAFTEYEFLKAMKKRDSSRDYKWLRTFVDRIGETRFAFYFYKDNERWERYTGVLAPQDFECSDGKFAVQMSKPLYALFGFDGWSFIDLNQRLALGQKQWAQAFHAYLSTHQCPRDGLWWRKDQLWREWGPEYKSLRSFLDKFRSRVLKPLYEIEFIGKVEEKKNAIGIWWKS